MFYIQCTCRVALYSKVMQKWRSVNFINLGANIKIYLSLL